MPATQASHAPSSVLAVVVLYNCEISQSQSSSSLFQILGENPELAQDFSVVIYDNSERAQSAAWPVGFPIHYVHDPSNGGLASAYNYALMYAEREEREWLLLLDQDTSPTREFLFELVGSAKTLHPRTEVGAIVPKLVVNGIIHSPATDFIYQMRQQFSAPIPPISADLTGVQKRHMTAYNSGSTLRVSALRSIGGFPAEFWLDFLDHAVFDALYGKGYRVYIMLASLAHEASYSDLGTVPEWRLHNVLMAQTLYMKKSGTFIERLLYRIWLLRHSRNLRRSCKEPRMWRETVLQALLFKAPPHRGDGNDPPVPASRH